MHNKNTHTHTTTHIPVIRKLDTAVGPEFKILRKKTLQIEVFPTNVSLPDKRVFPTNVNLPDKRVFPTTVSLPEKRKSSLQT